MKIWFLFFGLLVLLGTYLAFSPSAVRYLKSVWLILQVKPYEQTGTGSGQIVILGDSTGYGTGASQSEDSIAGRIGYDFPTYAITNYSQNAATLATVYEIAKEKLPHESLYDLILIQAGANDVMDDVTLAQSEADLRQLLQISTDHAASVIMMSSGNIGGAPAFTGDRAETLRLRTLEFRAMFMSVASEYDVFYVDLYEEPENDIFIQESATLMALDGLHPTSLGYEKWYQSLRPVVETVLNK